MRKTNKLPLWLAVATIGLSAPAFGQNAAGLDAQRQAQQRAQQDQKNADREQKREDRRERELLKNMPKEARAALESQVRGAQGDVDYYKTEVDNQRAFGAIFKDSTGQVVDVRVDRTGKVLSRLGAAQGATPLPAAAPAAAPAAEGDPIQANANSREPGAVNFRDMPAPVQQAFRQETRNGRDIHFYQVNGGYEARLLTAPDDPRRALLVRVAPSGEVLGRRPIEPGDVRIASAGAAPAAAPAAPAAPASPSRLPDPVQANADSRDRDAINFRDMPPAVQETMRTETRNGRNIRFYRGKFGSQDVYVANLLTDPNDPRGELAVRVDASGKVVERRALGQEEAQTAAAEQKRDPFLLTAREIPARARDALDRELKGASDVRYYRAKLGSQDVIEGKGQLKNGNDLAIRVDDSGKVLDRREIKDNNAPRDPFKLTLSEIPSAARRTIERESQGKRDVRYYRAKLGSQDVYEVKFDNDKDGETAIRVDDSGKVVDRRDIK
jgi:hypothetical protein